MGEPPWKVLASRENPAADRCVDIFVRSVGSFGVEEYRRDPEDRRWTHFGYHGDVVFATRTEAEAAATRAVAWLRAG